MTILNITNYNKVFFETLIQNLNKINYCIIGDYTNLPECINHDLDFWTDDLNEFKIAIEISVEATGYKILISNSTSNGFNTVIYNSYNATINVIKLDVMCDCSFKSLIQLVTDKQFMQHTMEYKGYKVADSKLEAILHFLYPFLEWGKIKNKYRNEIKENVDKKLFFTICSKLFSDSSTKFIIESIHSGAWEKIEQRAAKFKKELFIRYFVFINMGKIKRIFSFIYQNFKRIIKPSGFSIAFTGLDGAGKTTIIEYVNDIFLKTLKSKKVHTTYWRPYILPEIKEIFGKKNLSSHSENVQNFACTRRSKNKIISFVKLCYYWVDYVLGHLKYGTIRNRGGVIIFDRHYLDMIIHPQRFQMNLPKWILHFFYKITPKPDITFFCWASPEVIHTRKKEFSEGEILSQTKNYLSEGKRIKNFEPLETNKSLFEEINEIFMRIILRNHHA